MFTGLVETIGTVTSLIPSAPTDSGGGGDGTSLTITPTSHPTFLSDASLGDSISVNGTCLTITELPPSTQTEQQQQQRTQQQQQPYFKVGIAPETLRRTNLGSLHPGSRVNLERACLASTRMGGHFVQGHVDTTARIARVTPDGDALTFRFVLRGSEKDGWGGGGRAGDLMRYVVEKGYVTVDGASLTVTRVSDELIGRGGEGEVEGEDEEGGSWFEVMLISYTQEKVVTASKKVGDEVNVEIDVVGKYVEKSVGAYFERIMGGGQGDDGGEVRAPAILEKMVGRIVERRMRSAEKR